MWNFVLFLLLAVAPVSRSEVREHVDLVELNEFHDVAGRHVYDQVIFYEWSPNLNRYHVRAWCLVDDRDLISRRPQRDYRTGLYVVHWQDRDQNILRTITATHYRHSFSQVDPERENKKLLPEAERQALIRRQASKQSVEQEPQQ